jgi:hypothetical protein
MSDRDASMVAVNTLAFLVKRGITGGHSLLAELGLKNATSVTDQKSTSAYVWTQGTMKIVRGLFLQSHMEYFKADTSKLATENLRLGLGLMVFPFQRAEFRLSGVSGRVLDPTKVTRDTWSMLSQVHLSF